MADEKENEFKVIDRRGATREESKTATKQEGDGFTMKAPPEQEPTHAGSVDFATLCLSFATSAMIQLGIAPDPVTKKMHRDIELARQNIDILELLAAKTKGNLTAEEKELVEGLLSEVRLRFVEATQRK